MPTRLKRAEMGVLLRRASEKALPAAPLRFHGAINDAEVAGEDCGRARGYEGQKHDYPDQSSAHP